MTTTLDIETVPLHTSYLTLDARNPLVRDAVVDAHLMHRLVMSGWSEDAFPGEKTPRANLKILYAVDLGHEHLVRLVVQSATPAKWQFDDGILHRPADQRVRTAPLTGTIAFQLTAAPRKSQGERGRDSEGNLLRGKQYPLPAEDREPWGIQVLARAGLDVISLDIGKPTIRTSAIKSPPRREREHATPRLKGGFAHTTIRYTGHARIVDPTAHQDALTTGIGPAKAYGCGLLLTRTA